MSAEDMFTVIGRCVIDGQTFPIVDTDHLGIPVFGGWHYGLVTGAREEGKNTLCEIYTDEHDEPWGYVIADHLFEPGADVAELYEAMMEAAHNIYPVDLFTADSPSKGNDS